MKAVIASAPSLVADDASSLGWPTRDLVGLCHQGGGSLLASPTKSASVFAPLQPRSFEATAIGPSARLFEGAWGRALLRRVSQITQIDGSVTLPLHPDVRATKNGFFTLDALAQFFRSEPRVFGSFANFDNTSQPATVESTLDWWFRAAFEIIALEIAIATPWDLNEWISASRSSLSKFIDNEFSELSDLHKEYKEEPLTGGASQELSTALARQSYYVGGINYKGASLTHIINQHLGVRHFEYIDFGGGYGLLAAEIALTFPDAKCTTRDPSVLNLIFADALFRGLPRSVGQRFRFSFGASETFEFTRSFDVITFIGSLLYTPPAMRRDLLYGCWDYLNPGGVLVVHENIKNDAYQRNAEYDTMFTVPEIDALLGEFGDIMRYASTSIRTLTKEEAGDKSVFRLVQKR